MQSIQSQEIECIKLLLVTIKKLKGEVLLLSGNARVLSQCFSALQQNKAEVEIPSFEYTPPLTVLQQSVKIVNTQQITIML